MILSKKNVVLFISIAVFGVILFFPKPFLAVEEGDTKTIECSFTDCEKTETVNCGTARYKCGTCCDECTDEETGETYSCNCHDCDCCWDYGCGFSRTQYRASSEDCTTPTIDRRICRGVCSNESEGRCDCRGCTIECGVWEGGERVGASEKCEECESWQKAVTDSCENPNSIEWCNTKSECKCCGECIKKPGGLQEYQTPDSSKEAEVPAKLPVKLDWSDVPGFWNGEWEGAGSNLKAYGDCQREHSSPCWDEVYDEWKADPENADRTFCMGEPENQTAHSECMHGYCDDLIQEVEECTGCPALDEEEECYNKNEFVNYYQIVISGKRRNCETLEEVDGYNSYLEVSEFFAPCPCFFKSGEPYEWKVRACCKKDQENACGPWSDKRTFATSPAPEPKLPYDPDWAGSGGATNVPITEKLQWCPVDEDKPQEERMLSYSLLFYLIKNGVEECHPLLKDATGECNPKLILPEPEAGFLSPNPEFSNEKYGFFTKNNFYSWEVAACKDLAAEDCTDYSQKWRFTIQANLLPPDLIAPPNDPTGEKPTELPVLLRWQGSLGSNSYIYELSPIGQGTTTPPNASFDFPKLSLDAFYTWKVKPCWDYGAKDCENVWSEVYTFKTTGRPPKPESMKPEGPEIPIPIRFEWEDVPGAKSFIFKIQGDGLNLEEPTSEASFSLDYPDLHQEKNYSWQVKTCAKEKDADCVKNQTCCGVWSTSKNLTTFKLDSPSEALLPEDNSEIAFSQFPIPFSWEEVPWARYYKFALEYVSKSPEESSEECTTGGKEERIVLSNQAPTPLRCLGNYQWQVVACLDKDCIETGELSPLWRFTLIQKAEGKTTGGLVPCGRTYDNQNTPQWNERDSCQIKHLFLIIHIILNFILWKIAPLMLVLLTIISGVLYYIAMGEIKTIVQVKTLWKAAGIGYAIIFFGWLIIDIFLSILGYRVGIFGPWWRIKF